MFFPNAMLECWKYQELEEYTDYGDPIFKYELMDIVPCDIQPLSVADTQKTYGKILQDAYKVYLPLDVQLDDKMIFRIQDEPSTYQVIGSPMRYDHFLKHQKLELQKQRTPTTLEE